LEPSLAGGADRIGLGCTHYPFLEAPLREVIGERSVELVNPAPAVARRAEWLLEEADMRAEEGHKAEYLFISFADEEYRRRVESRAAEIVVQSVK
jgi:glutamate racemase